MAKIHRNLKDIPVVRLNDPEYKEAKRQLDKNPVYGHSTKYAHENVTKHNTEYYAKRRRKASYKLPTVIKDGDIQRTYSLSKSQHICYKTFAKLKKKHNHVTKEIMVAITHTSTVKALIKAGLLEEYTQKNVQCLAFKQKDLDLSKRVGKITINIPC